MNNLKEPHNKEIFNLIEKITPLNNRYRDLVKEASSGKEVLILMWRVGEILHDFIRINKLKPHNLYWKVYGKSEGTRTSYITRDFLSYCFRIHKYFKNEQEINTQFPNLKKYSLFREAFPLLENPKFRLDNNERQSIVKLLNSNNPTLSIKHEIIILKKKKIGIKNTRKQRLKEMEPDARVFVAFYNLIYKIIKENDQDEIDNFRKNFKNNDLENLSTTVASLIKEGLYVPKINYKKNGDSRLDGFIDTLQDLLVKKIEDRNRFRRMFPPRKLVKLADMLYALTSDKQIQLYRKKILK